MFKLKNYKSISDREDQTTAWWKKSKTFEKSIEARPKDNRYSFLDGPPFVTGMPHYGHLVGRIAKDLIPRYQTMKGKRVRRVWGWDCHGLPIEEKVEKKIGLNNRRDIEKFGINKFLEECHTYVSDVSSEWEWYVDKIGEWIDFKGSYKTMDTDYMESVIWVFKELYDKGLIYEGVKTLLYCTRCGTPVSKFEIAMDDSYKNMEDPAITVEFPITSKGKFEGARILAWTTTPWTMPSNRALVVDPSETYIEFSGKEAGKTYIAAKKRLKEIVGDDKYKVVREFKGKELLGLSYKAPYDYFPPSKNDFKVYEYKGMVTMDEGTGVVHSAPGFGEIDTEMGKHYNLSMMYTVDDAGNFVDKVKDFAGMYVKKADKHIIENLEKRDLLFRLEKITHRYPFCYRCQTPLIQRAQKGWFIDIQNNKKKLLQMNKSINWVPDKLTKRFVNTVKSAPDWNISRTRYWATVMPVWKCSECEETEILGSIKEIEKRSEQKVKNLHRDGVDHIEFKCRKCKSTMKRIPEVLDCWMESASMPYGQIHYPFENKELFKQTFPANYIVEYVGQIRAWFYYMHVVSNLLVGKNSYINVVNTGTMAGNDGRKMSKLFKNYPDPKLTLEQYGGDALRLYFMSSPIMIGEDANIDETEIKNQVSTVVFPLSNTLKYFTTYANLHKWENTEGKKQKAKTNQLDKWILARLKQFHNDLEFSLERYEIPPATRAIAPFLSDLSTWYIRRSRDRFVTGDKDALATLYYVLVQTAKIITPIAPFIAEEVYQRLVVDNDKQAPESVHLCDWPEKQKVTVTEKKLLSEMAAVREVASLGQAARVEAGIKVRQPLNELKVKGQKLKVWASGLLKDELNVKEIKEVKSIKKSKGWNIQSTKIIEVALDTTITNDLKQEGLVRELARTIQDARKKLGFNQEDKVNVILESDNENIQQVVKKYNEELCSQTNSKKVEFGSGEKEVIVNGNKLKIHIT
jgi:isoleucyl-tRNA synthetase